MHGVCLTRVCKPHRGTALGHHHASGLGEHVAQRPSAAGAVHGRGGARRGNLLSTTVATTTTTVVAATALRMGGINGGDGGRAILRDNRHRVERIQVQGRHRHD